MAGDGGFEGNFVRELNQYAEERELPFFAKRFKQHRFSSQLIDVVIYSDQEDYYSAIECKSKQIDIEKTQKDNNQTEGKLYFSQAFSKTDDGHQIERASEFIDKGQLQGFLAIAYRRGRGRKVHYYGLSWNHVKKLYEDDDCSGIKKSYVEEHGVLLHESDTLEELEEKKQQDMETNFTEIFNA